MRRAIFFTLAMIMMLALVFGAFGGSAQAAPNDNACWGQATKVFTRMYGMGDHASTQANPRLGLRNLARTLADAGVIPDDSMASLGVFVATELGLSIEACGT